MITEKKTLALTSEQILFDEQKEIMAYTVQANVSKTDYGFNIEYIEPASTGLENTTTLLQVYPEPTSKVILERKGESDFKQSFAKGESNSSIIKLPFGEMENEITTNEIIIKTQADAIEIQISYDLKMNGEHLSQNTLNLKLS